MDRSDSLFVLMKWNFKQQSFQQNCVQQNDTISIVREKNEQISIIGGKSDIIFVQKVTMYYTNPYKKN